MVLILFMTNYSKTLFESAFIASFGERCFLEGPLAAYAHSLLYRCEQCTEPLVLSVISEEANLETIDGNTYQVKCMCGWKENLPGFQAIKHYVVPWERTQDNSA